MKQILLVISSFAVLMLAGCTVSPSVLGNNVAGIGNVGAPENLVSASAEVGLAAAPVGAPVSTGSIVPLLDEGAVVDLPSSDDRVQVLSAHENAEVQILDEQLQGTEQALSPQELHRRELINRGDLQEGQSLPVE